MPSERLEPLPAPNPVAPAKTDEAMLATFYEPEEG